MYGIGKSLNLNQPVNRSAPANRDLTLWLQAGVSPSLQGGTRMFDLLGKTHATLVNGPAWAGGYGTRHGSVVTDGSNDYLSLSPPADPNLPLTWLFYIYHFDAAKYFNVFAYGQGNGQLGFYGTSRALYSVAGNFLGATALQDRTWYQVGFAADANNTLKLIVNGKYDASQTSANFGGGLPTVIGKYSSGGFEANCAFSTVRCFKRFLTEAELTRDWNAWKRGFENEVNWIRRPVVFDLGGGGGGFQPAWVYNSNIVIQPAMGC